LVDEYQDTNLMQEKIYFCIAKSLSGSLTVVGDDDQSLYRFRGATVDLFRDFEKRYKNEFNSLPNKVYLSVNYRSTKNIINFVNKFSKLDKAYQSVRVKSKPEMKPSINAQIGVPVLGMFRSNQSKLAEDLANFVHLVFKGKGFKLRDGQVVISDRNEGDVGDCAFLCSSPKESKQTNNGTELRLPGLLRSSLEAKSPPIIMFNPRGQDFHEIDLIQQFGGAILTCLDSDRLIQSNITHLNNSVHEVLDSWRDKFDAYTKSSKDLKGLVNYVHHWSNRTPGKSGTNWPINISCIDLIYGLTHYFPKLYNDSEGQIFLEVFTRQLSACEETSAFKGRIVSDPNNSELSGKSVRDLIQDFLAPIAAGTVKVEEEMIDSFPRDMFSVLSIHQSKGLEFPLVIVDIGSEFKSNHRAHAFKRFPTGGSLPHKQEDLVRIHSEIGVDLRLPVDRAFDDLIRQFFVAYSRPQEVLLLVGLIDATTEGRIPNVSFGFNRNGIFNWSHAESIPMELI